MSFRTLVSQCRQLFLVFGQARAFIVKATNLPLEFPDRPVAPRAFNLIENALGFIRNCNQFREVAEGEFLDQL